MADNRPLPAGWVSRFDDNYQQVYYVNERERDANGNYKSSWIHPYDDENYLKAHPEAREKIGARRSSEHMRPPGPPPNGRRPSSYSGQPSRSQDKEKDKDKRGFLSKLKDKAIGTKEEREAARREEMRINEERRQRALEMQRQRQQQQQQLYGSRFGQGGYGQQGYAPQSGFGGGYYPPQQQGYYAQQAPAQRRTGGFGGGGMALPLIGGLAGGLLLGEAFDGGDGGGFGGGDGGFGGGDGGGFDGGGGDFGGGDF